MTQPLACLDSIQEKILMKLHQDGSHSITDLIRNLKLGGETFYRHKEALVVSGLIRELTGKSSKVRTVRLELTNNGIRVAVLLEQISVVLESANTSIDLNYAY